MKTTNFTSPKHGAIISITREQADRLEKYWADKVSVNVDLTKSVEPMKPLWAWFGYDEPNYTYMKDGKKLLTEISRLSPVPVNVRAHNLLTTGDGEAALKWGSTNIYTEDRKGRPVYQWNIVDSIFDTYVARGMRPLVQIGFTPKALSTNPEPYRHHWTPDAKYDEIFTGWAYPPNDYDKWRELIYQWAYHCKERYGEEEVSKWYWEVWNEPNGYLRGSFEDYCKIYDYAVDGLLRALPNAVVGGPHTTGPGGKSAREYLRKFLEHCISGTNYATGKKGSPLGYIGFHAKGNPRFNDGKVMMSIKAQLNDVDAGLKLVGEFPELKELPIIIGEFDPEGCAACSSEYTPQYNYRNGTMYSSTVANSYARLYELARKYNANLVGAVTWAFEFENQPWFAGFRDLSTNGVAKPVLNVFRMFGQMGGDIVESQSTGMLPIDSIVRNGVRKQPDIGILASRNDSQAAVMLWNYHDLNDTDVEPAEIQLSIKTGTNVERVLVTHYRIDSEYSNSYTKWQEMGCPQNPDEKQLKELQKAGDLQTFGSPVWKQVSEGMITDSFFLPRQGVSFLKIELK
ncbi:MAG: beta-xylosidase [Bacteroidaceae bacterium]|nr:beta-xylosidase [Bacteroidaceae bacterium]